MVMFTMEWLNISHFAVMVWLACYYLTDNTVYGWWKPTYYLLPFIKERIEHVAWSNRSGKGVVLGSGLGAWLRAAD